MAENPFDPGHLIGHVKDADYFEVPRFIDGVLGGESHPDGRIAIPQPLHRSPPIFEATLGQPGKEMVEPLELGLTKFMVIEFVAAIVIAVTFIWLARKIAGGGRPRGRVWNLLEAMLVFLRDEVARPAIGKRDADKFLPFLWTIFFFVLACNLFGMLPWSGSPTGALATTGALALMTFGTVVGAGTAKMGPIGFWVGQVPHMELPLVLAIVLKPMIFGIEVMGLLIKHFVLAVRLLANMFAGHLVLAVLVTFIAAAWNSHFIWAIAPASILAAVALSLLELFVAFLQAYIFMFLSALFIGMAIHPH